jgi:hypothetical protein
VIEIGENPQTILALTYSNASTQASACWFARKSEQLGHEFAQPGYFLLEMNQPVI